jgi:GT2 family glycosyltransferase
MISIITVNYKTLKYLPKLLDSIQEYVQEDFEYIIVDNNSGDNLDELASRYDFIKIIYSEKNTGFGSGINRGVQDAKGEYLYFLNPDTYLLSDILKIQKNVLESYPKAGMVGGCMTKNDGTVQAFQYGSEQSLLDVFFMTKKKEQSQKANDTVHEVDWVSGGAMMVKKDAFQAVGGFDERFFMYFEDIDLSKRLREAGYKVYWTPDAKLYHAEGGAEKVYKNTKKRYYASQRKYYTKHVGKIWSWILWPFHQLLLMRYE